ncbi:hypothetical protein CS542_08100 [Pedobacter sp. IW39]|nr:hypothetical protein CS542_08100 [Pedobacter sp. IW39]
MFNQRGKLQNGFYFPSSTLNPLIFTCPSFCQGTLRKAIRMLAAHIPSTVKLFPFPDGINQPQFLRIIVITFSYPIPRYKYPGTFTGQGKD